MNAEQQPNISLKSKPYPSTLLEAILIALIFIMASVVSLPVLFAFALIPIPQIQSLSFFFYYASMASITAILVYLLKKNSERETFLLPKLHFKEGVLALLLVLMTITLQQGFILPLTNLIPVPDFLLRFLSYGAQAQTIGNILAIVVLAPIFEEYIFRGMLLDGLLKSHSPWKAIVLSAFLFAFVHLNPWQFVSAFTLGIFIGWIYCRTKNLALCILIHFINNAFAIFCNHFYNYLPWKESSGSTLHMIYVIMMLIVTVLLFFLVKERLSNQHEEEIELEDQEEELSL